MMARGGTFYTMVYLYNVFDTKLFQKFLVLLNREAGVYESETSKCSK